MKEPKIKTLGEVGDGIHPYFDIEYIKNIDTSIYDDTIIGENPSSFMTSEQPTMELKFINEKLHQKILITNYSAAGTENFVTEEWREIEGQ